MRETYYDEHTWSYLGRKTVCCGCPDRYVGCHGSCEKYQEERDKLKRERDSVKDDFEYTHAHQRKSIKATRKNNFVQKHKKGEY